MVYVGFNLLAIGEVAELFAKVIRENYPFASSDHQVQILFMLHVQKITKEKYSGWTTYILFGLCGTQLETKQKNILPQIEKTIGCSHFYAYFKEKDSSIKEKNYSADKCFIPSPSTESIITTKQKFKRKYTSNQNYASTVERETHLTNIKSEKPT